MGLFDKFKSGIGGTKSKDAASLVSKGRQLIKSGGYDELEETLECFDKAISIDPKYAEAWCFKGATLPAFNR